MSYVVLISRSAERQIARLPREVSSRVRAVIDSLAQDPRPHGCKKLSGAEQYRIRVGDYRVIYEIEDAELRVFVVRAARRDSVY